MNAPLKPGGRMSQDQHDLFWRLWNAAVRCQRWTASEAAGKRHEILAELGFASAKHIGARDGFDRVRKRLEALADQLHNERPDEGQRRRLVWLISQAQAELSAAGYPARTAGCLARKGKHGKRTASCFFILDLKNRAGSAGAGGGNRVQNAG
jgi:hypothetical protein